MDLSTVHEGVHKRKRKKRVGRGTGSGRGKTSTRGHKGTAHDPRRPHAAARSSPPALVH